MIHPYCYSRSKVISKNLVWKSFCVKLIDFDVKTWRWVEWEIQNETGKEIYQIENDFISFPIHIMRVGEQNTRIGEASDKIWKSLNRPDS